MSGYIKMHPGGADLVEEYLGKTIDKAFTEQGHTNQARLVFRDLEKIGYLQGEDKHVGKDIANLKGMDGIELQSKITLDYNKGIYW